MSGGTDTSADLGDVLIGALAAGVTLGRRHAALRPRCTGTIRDNLEALIIDARREGWLGAVEETTLRRKVRASELGMPSFDYNGGDC